MKGSLTGSNSTWSTTSLTGDFDQVTALAFDVTGATFYAGTTAVNVTAGGGIYKSTNDGVNWTAATSGIAATTIDAIAVDPITTTTVYAIAEARFIRHQQRHKLGGGWPVGGHLRVAGDRTDQSIDHICGVEHQLAL